MSVFWLLLDSKEVSNMTILEVVQTLKQKQQYHLLALLRRHDIKLFYRILKCKYRIHKSTRIAIAFSNAQSEAPTIGQYLKSIFQSDEPHHTRPLPITERGEPIKVTTEEVQGALKVLGRNKAKGIDALGD